MASAALDDAYDRVLDSLPTDWKIVSMKQDAGGWLVTAAKVLYKSPGGLEYYPSVSARAGLLTKALNRLADKMESHNAKP